MGWRDSVAWLRLMKMSVIAWLRRRFAKAAEPVVTAGSPAPYELRHLMEIRHQYLQQFETTARLEASAESHEGHIRELRQTIERWERRLELRLEQSLHDAVVDILDRYRSYLSSAEDVRRSTATLLCKLHQNLDEMLSDLTELGGQMARLGFDTRSLSLEIDLAAVQRMAREQNVQSLLEEGAFEPDEEERYLDRLFTPPDQRLS